MIYFASYVSWPLMYFVYDIHIFILVNVKVEFIFQMAKQKELLFCQKNVRIVLQLHLEYLKAQFDSYLMGTSWLQNWNCWLIEKQTFLKCFVLLRQMLRVMCSMCRSLELKIWTKLQFYRKWYIGEVESNIIWSRCADLSVTLLLHAAVFSQVCSELR